MSNTEPKNGQTQANTAAAPPVSVPTAMTQSQLPQPFREQVAQESPTEERSPLVLLVLDGWGVAPPSRGNAISIARTPHMDKLMSVYPTMTLHASGEMVGLPPNEMGNSEVGHISIGSGKIIYQQLPLINRAIENGLFYENEVFKKAIENAKETGKQVHLMGMVSDGGIHSNQDHLYALLLMCKDSGLTQEDVLVHVFLDGRDTEPDKGMQFLAELETKMVEMRLGRVATVSGRRFAMDRDNHWDRTEAAYNAICHGKSEHTSDSPLKALEDGYAEQVFDEEFPPTVILKDDGTPEGTVGDGDSIIFFNFRSDRARQLTRAFVMPEWNDFDRGQQIKDLSFVTMTEYEDNLPVQVAFKQEDVKTPVSKVVADAGLPQLHIAETEKYAHVTFFFNGGREDSFPGEERALVQSPKVQSYDKAPEMSVEKIADRITMEVERGHFKFIVANIANADMIGHTGNLEAAITAIEAADTAIGRIADAVQGVGGTLVISADHGNADEMLDARTDEIKKEHSTNPVPCIIANPSLSEQRAMWPPVSEGDLSRMQPVGVLSDLGPTLLRLMDLPIPPEMTGRSLIR
jgi:2,3-bisphosphoglycerate-independent phosphoglycerate mutase